MFATGAWLVALPLIAIQRGLDSILLGGAIAAYLVGALGLGALAGGLLMTRWGKRIMTFQAMMTLWMMGSLAWLLVAGTTHPMVIARSLFVMGVFNASGNVCWSTMLQACVPTDYRGRMASADWLVSISLVPVSTVVAGYLALNHASLWILLAGIVPAVLGVTLLLIVGRVSATDAEPNAPGNTEPETSTGSLRA